MTTSVNNWEYIQELEKGRTEIYKKPRVCLIPNCTNQAILNSHVLQRKKVLEKIADNTGKFYVLDRTSLFNTENAGLMVPQKKGLKQSYIFSGFCAKCDSSFFKEIETQKVDFRLRRAKSLFAYRTLCLELRKKEISLEHIRHILSTRKKFFPGIVDYFDFRPTEQAISDLQFFKKELESELLNGKKKFKHFCIKLPQRKLCFSSPLNIYDRNNPLTSDIDEYGYSKQEPLVTSILNYFPYERNSYLLASFHKKLICNWTIDMLASIRKNVQSADQIISDIITYRVEFWAISPTIYETWNERKLKKFNTEMTNHTFDHSYKIKSKFSIWK